MALLLTQWSPTQAQTYQADICADTTVTDILVTVLTDMQIYRKHIT